MKIAIVGPSPVPFAVGGVENLLWGLLGYINQNTEHNCELIKLPSREDNFWNIINTYKSFWKLDLSYFDLVVSTKYPAWMVEHPNHICYLQHRLRGLYDTYHFTKLPTDFQSQDPLLRKIIEFVDGTYEAPDLKKFFGIMDELYQNRLNYSNDIFNFPHPFIRKLVHYMDNAALSNGKIKEFYCISDTVKRRTEYFPKGITPTAIHHPSFLKEYHCREYKFLFTICRLDNAKRVRMMIEAMKYVNEDIDLIIAGKGPEEAELKELAKDDNRIKFIGFVNDTDVIEYYADALAVLYVPYDEDFGLVTIEAMMSKKPVITCNDSGGTNEFVTHKKTGLIAEPNPKSLGQQISYICKNRDEAVKMGEEGFKIVSNITWGNTVSTILQNVELINTKSIKQENRKKITVTSNFAVYPPKGGGQSRIFNLYKNVAKDYDVEIISLANNDLKQVRREISENLIETVIPKTVLQAEKEWEYEKEIGTPVSDSALPIVSRYTPEYGEALKKSIEQSDMVVVSHPYLLHEVERFIGDKPFIYEAHNVEYTLKKNVYKNNNKKTKEILDLIFETEKRACEKSKFVMTCSEEDKITLSNLYKVPLDKFIVVPNGVDCDEIQFVSPEQRKENKKALGLEDENIAIFIGSWHVPNIEAARYVFDIAKELPEVKFLIIGSVCAAVKDDIIPENVGLMGVVSDEEKNLIYGIADVALNPMTSGSGTNLKMFDYMAAGIPVITTEFGARGLRNDSVTNLIVENVNTIKYGLSRIIQKELNIEQLVQCSRIATQKYYDWKIISNYLISKI